MSGVADAMRDGGFAMWAILGVGVLGSAISVERLYFVLRQGRIDGGAFMAQVQRAVLDADLDRALQICSTAPDAALPKLLQAALIRASRPESEIRDALEEARLALLPRIRRRVGLLALLARGSIWVGGIGALHGVIVALEAAGAAGSTAGLAAGTAVGLHSALFGSIVALSLATAHGLIAVRTAALLDDLDHHAFKIVVLLKAGRHHGGAHGGGSPVLPFPG